MKVLHITNAYPTENNPSYGIFIKEQVDSLSAMDIECEVIFINALEKGKREYFRNVALVREKARQYDIIHCHHSYSAFFTYYIARVRKPLITSFLSTRHGESKNKWLGNNVIEQCIKASNAFIFKNDPDVGKNYPGKGWYIPNGVNLNFFKEMDKAEAIQQLNLSADKKYLLFVASGGTARRDKRYDIFCEVIHLLKNNYQIPVDELVMTNTARPYVPYYFNAASLHLLTSDVEGSPNSVKEAMACNLPVVSTNVGNVTDMLTGLQGCYISKSNAPEELAALAIEALKHPRTKGREVLIASGLDLDTTARKIITLYKQVLQ